jgi:hypothetical protein
MTTDRQKTNGAATVTLEVTDVSRQKLIRARKVSRDASVGEFVRGILPEMRLPATSGSGEPYTYHVRLEREGRHLHGSERVGDALKENDRIVLQPNVDAGAR